MIPTHTFLSLALRLGFAVLPSAALAAPCVVDAGAGGVQAFLESPDSLWRSETSSTKNIMLGARNFAKSPKTLQALSQAASRANAAQRAEIGEGLAGAFLDCVIGDAPAARRISDAVRRLSDDALTRAFRRKIGDVSGEGPPHLVLPPSEASADRSRTLPIGIVHGLGTRTMPLDNPFKLDNASRFVGR